MSDLPMPPNMSLFSLQHLTRHCANFAERNPKDLPACTIFVKAVDGLNHYTIVSATGIADAEFMENLAPALQDILDGFHAGEGTSKEISNRDN